MRLAFSVLFLPLLIPSRHDEEFVKLFNGKDLSGWKFALEEKDADPAKTFLVKDGVLVCTGDPGGYMYTDKNYKNFTLRLDWRYKRPEKLEDDSKFGGNSGYLIHVVQHGVLGIWPKSVEVQGMNRDAGKILPIPRELQCKYEDFAEARKKALHPVGEWNSTEIVSKDGTLIVNLNGVKVAAVSECELKEGAIGFQSEGAEIHWRNIQIKEDK